MTSKKGTEWEDIEEVGGSRRGRADSKVLDRQLQRQYTSVWSVDRGYTIKDCMIIFCNVKTESIEHMRHAAVTSRKSGFVVTGHEA